MNTNGLNKRFSAESIEIINENKTQSKVLIETHQIIYNK